MAETDHTRAVMGGTTRDGEAVDPSGVPGLDVVLGGGLPRGALVIVVGPPGSGKTTLATQMAFAAARGGHRALLLTALSEPISKLIAHLRPFAFFDEALLGGPVQILSLEQFLPQGLATTSDHVRSLARDVGDGVIDGFRGMQGADATFQVTRAFLYDVGRRHVSRCNVRQAGPYPPERGPVAACGGHARRQTVSGWTDTICPTLSTRGGGPCACHLPSSDGGGAVAAPKCFQTIVAGCEPRTQRRATAVAARCHATAVAGLFRTVKLEAFSGRSQRQPGAWPRLGPARPRRVTRPQAPPCPSPPPPACPRATAAAPATARLPGPPRPLR